MGAIRFGPARVPSSESPEEAIELLLERGYSACEIDFEGGFWMDYPWAERFGELAREAKIALSVHAPLAGFMGHVERDKKHRMAIGMLDHSAGVARPRGAELVVFHPGFLLGRTREDALDVVVEQLGELRERLEGKGRAVPVRRRGDGPRARARHRSTTCSRSRARLAWVRPVIDFAHLHAMSDGAFTDAEPFAAVLEAADACSSRARRSTSTSPTSPTRTATRRSTCPTARARCGRSRWREALRASSGPRP